MPEAHIVKATAKIYDLQDPTSKMSKSALSPNGVVSLLDSRKQVAKKIRSAMTDSGTEIVYDPVDQARHRESAVDLLGAHRRVRSTSIVKQYEGQQYGHLKVALADLVADFVSAFGDRTRELLDDRGELDRILAQGAQQAREVASATLELVYERSGFVRGIRA